MGRAWHVSVSIASLLILHEANSLPESVTIQTACGSMRSGPLITVASGSGDSSSGSRYVVPFKGVRYAEPMSSENRWQPPQRARCWEGTYDASSFAQTCVQPSGGGSEDCLSLNVYSPYSIFSPASASPSRVRLRGAAHRSLNLNASPLLNDSSTQLQALLPVMVYIHGGGLVGGDSYTNVWQAAAGSQNSGPVVAVSIAYRLNVFGFLATPELSEEQGGSSGNYGIMDQQLALEWVRDNIVHYGGDPNMVTVIGHSSGGTSIFALMSSPLSRGLFHRAISLSGSPNITMDLHTAEAQNAGVVSKLECDTSDDARERLACMRAAPASKLASAMPPSWYTPGIWGMPKGPQGQQYAGIPIVDGAVITAPFEQALKDAVVDVPFIIANMGYENANGPEDHVDAMSQDQWVDFLEHRFTQWAPGVGTQLHQHYASEAASSPQMAYDAINADTGLTCASVDLTRGALSNGGAYTSPIYVLVNNWHPAPQDGDQVSKYAYHGWDVGQWLADYSTEPECMGPLVAGVDSDDKLSTCLRSFFYDFAVNGKLSADVWPAVNQADNWPKGYTTMVFDRVEGPKAVTRYKGTVCDFYRSLGITEGFWWCD